MNILYIEPFLCKGDKFGHYTGLYNEFTKITNCYVFDKKNIKNISDAISACPFSPDAIIFGIGWFGAKRYGEIKGLKHLDIPVICHMFRPQNDLPKKLNFCKINKVDLIITPVPAYKQYEEETGIPAKLFPYGFDPKVFKDYGLRKRYDFGFSGAMHNAKHYISNAFETKNIRESIHEILKRRTDLRCFLNGSDSISARINNQKQYAKTINKSKIWLATPAAFGDITPRYLEVAMSRTLIFTSKIPEEYRHIYKDGINCVQFSDNLSDFMDKLDYYLSNDDERMRITNNAYNELRSKNTWEYRAKELVELIRIY